MEIKQAVTALAALAQDSRLQVFRLLVQVGPAGLAAGEIAKELGIPPATLSFHLKELTHAGLVHSRKDGRSVIYGLHVDGIQGLMAFLIADCCQGRPELCASGGMVSCRAEASEGVSSGTTKTQRKVKSV